MPRSRLVVYAAAWTEGGGVDTLSCPGALPLSDQLSDNHRVRRRTLPHSGGCANEWMSPQSTGHRSA
jgi:hypothetical protein